MDSISRIIEMRQEQIENAALTTYGTTCRAADHFARGAEWADAHPSAETFKRVVTLYKLWYTTESYGDLVSFITENWENKRIKTI